MANMPAAEYACRRAKNVPSLSIGVHLTLSQGRPLSPIGQIPDLVDKHTGFFVESTRQRRHLWWGEKVLQQVQREFTVQIERALELGVTPTHCDSHHSIHNMPLARAAMIKVLQKFGIWRARSQGGYYWTSRDAGLSLRLLRLYCNMPRMPKILMMRWNEFLVHRSGVRTADRKVSRAMLIPHHSDSKRQLLACLAGLPAGISEISFHPGYPDSEVADSETFANVRQTDTALTTDRNVLAAIKEYCIDLISYADI